ncbi:hypothetical protein EMIT0158MI4_150170 [Burkholderia ambifaria]
MRIPAVAQIHRGRPESGGELLVLELVRFGVRGNRLCRAVGFRPELSALTQLGPHVPARCKSLPSLRAYANE